MLGSPRRAGEKFIDRDAADGNKHVERNVVG
jgi:hypothetical protein